MFPSIALHFCSGISFHFVPADEEDEDEDDRNVSISFAFIVERGCAQLSVDLVQVLTGTPDSGGWMDSGGRYMVLIKMFTFNWSGINEWDFNWEKRWTINYSCSACAWL